MSKFKFYKDEEGHPIGCACCGTENVRTIKTKSEALTNRYFCVFCYSTRGGPCEVVDKQLLMQTMNVLIQELKNGQT